MIKNFQSLIQSQISSFTIKKENPYKTYMKNLKFSFPEIKPPEIPNYTINIKDFNAIGDGKTLCTKSFSKAIENLYSNGGGRLIIPSGIYLTGPIELKSNINLHLEIGSIIKFSEEEKYYPIIETSFEGLNTKRCQSLLSAKNSINISITGNGLIDGNGQFWRSIKKEKVTYLQWEDIIKKNNGIIINNNYWVPNEGYIKAEKKSNMNVINVKNDNELNEYKRFLRPVMINFINCKNIFLEGIIFQNSPIWNIHLLICEDVIIDNIYSKNPSYAQNGEGIDIESCKNVLIINCKFEAGKMMEFVLKVVKMKMEEKEIKYVKILLLIVVLFLIVMLDLLLVLK
jgi:polygalacturonase